MSRHKLATKVVNMMSPTKSKSAKKAAVKYKKAPQAPKRFKSAYIFFSTAKHPEIRKQLGNKGANEKTTEVAKLVSDAWKSLSEEERNVWEEKARQDKARFEAEKVMYTGPWKVPAKKRSQKDPNAPKRPMSAFLSFSNSKRASVKKDNPKMSNTEVSRILAQLWKDAPEEERKVHIDQEFKLRQEYKVAMAEWKEKTEREREEERQQREELARRSLQMAPSQGAEGGGSGEMSYAHNGMNGVHHDPGMYGPMRGQDGRGPGGIPNFGGGGVDAYGPQGYPPYYHGYEGPNGYNYPPPADGSIHSQHYPPPSASHGGAMMYGGPAESPYGYAQYPTTNGGPPQRATGGHWGTGGSDMRNSNGMYPGYHPGYYGSEPPPPPPPLDAPGGMYPGDPYGVDRYMDGALPGDHSPHGY